VRDQRKRKNQRQDIQDTRRRERLSAFGLTPEDYDLMLKNQDGVCAICLQAPPDDRRLAVDHDHNCCPGKRGCSKCIRGLLCTRCNVGLGYFNDNLAALQAAVTYLTK
jgi:hypothetical protein